MLLLEIGCLEIDQDGDEVAPLDVGGWRLTLCFCDEACRGCNGEEAEKDPKDVDYMHRLLARGPAFHARS